MPTPGPATLKDFPGLSRACIKGTTNQVAQVNVMALAAQFGAPTKLDPIAQSYLDALGLAETQYSLASFRYDLTETARQRPGREGPALPWLSIGRQGLLDLPGLPQTLEKIYAPLTAGLMAPFSADRILAQEKRCQLDRLYQRICDNLDALLRAVGLEVAA